MLVLLFFCVRVVLVLCARDSVCFCVGVSDCVFKNRRVCVCVAFCLYPCSS